MSPASEPNSSAREPKSSARRLFIGLCPPLETSERIHARAVAALSKCRARGLWITAARNIHLTLCFLGEVADGNAAVLEGALAAELRDRSAPDLVIRGTGAFPKRGRESVLWAGLEETAGSVGRFEGLRQAVVRAVRAASLEPDRHSVAEEFTPHLTLARIRGRVRVPDDFYAIAFDAAWRAHEVHVFQSDLAPAAPVRYPIVKSFRLGAQPGGAA